MRKTTSFEETSYWCSINMAEGLVKQRFEKTEAKSRKSLSFSLLEEIKKPKARTNQGLRLPAYGVCQKNNDIGQAYFFLPFPSPSPLSFFRPSTYP